MIQSNRELGAKLNEPIMTSPPREVRAVLNEIELELNELEGTLLHVKDTFLPVLSSEPDEAYAKEEYATCTPLGQDLTGVYKRIKFIKLELLSLLRRCQL